MWAFCLSYPTISSTDRVGSTASNPQIDKTTSSENKKPRNFNVPEDNSMSERTKKKLDERKWTLAALKDFGYPDIDEQHLFDLDGSGNKHDGRQDFIVDINGERFVLEVTSLYHSGKIETKNKSYPPIEVEKHKKETLETLFSGLDQKHPRLTKYHVTCYIPPFAPENIEAVEAVKEAVEKFLSECQDGEDGSVALRDAYATKESDAQYPISDSAREVDSILTYKPKTSWEIWFEYMHEGANEERRVEFGMVGGAIKVDEGDYEKMIERKSKKIATYRKHAADKSRPDYKEGDENLPIRLLIYAEGENESTLIDKENECLENYKGFDRVWFWNEKQYIFDGINGGNNTTQPKFAQ